MKKSYWLIITIFLTAACSQPKEDVKWAPEPVVHSAMIYSGEYIDGLQLVAEESFHNVKGDSLYIILRFTSDKLHKIIEAYEGRNVIEKLNIVTAKKTDSPMYSWSNIYFKESNGTIMSEWCRKHINDFSKIDLEELFMSPGDVFFQNLYLHIKSLKIYSTNQEVSGRPIGSDLSDLFYTITHSLYTYPDLAESISDYKLTLAELVELNMMQEPGYRIILPVHMTKENRESINLKIEMVVEDDVIGERKLISSDLVRYSSSSEFISKDREATFPYNYFLQLL